MHLALPRGDTIIRSAARIGLVIAARTIERTVGTSRKNCQICGRLLSEELDEDAIKLGITRNRDYWCRCRLVAAYLRSRAGELSGRIAPRSRRLIR